ncbi:MAG: SMI1/KNR4 family protein [Rhizobacter sp.]|nr:SMI1/KNR4 family protein [Rhizobacter sp.]MBX3628050.1 SMI1/KNR4 family protein [Rhizobacter sp.]
MAAFIKDVVELETELGGSLPGDYRSFLENHSPSSFGGWQLFRTLDPIPGSDGEEALDVLYSASRIVRDGMQGAWERKMLVIGGLQPGGYVYLCFEPENFGAVYVRYPYQSNRFYLAGRSFSEFQSRCRPYPESDA